MARTVTVKVDGLRQLGERMRNLSEDVNKKIARSVTAAGAGVIRKLAQQKAPKHSGNLARQIIMKRIPPSEARFTSEHIVTVRKGKGTAKQQAQGLKSAHYAHLIEYGYFRKYLAVETKQRGWITLKDRPLPAPVWVPPQPYMRPAFDTGKGAAVQAMKKALERRITKAGA